MANHFVNISRETIHGTLAKNIKPILEIESGDSVTFETLEGDWRWDRPEFPSSLSGKTFVERVMPQDRGHALCGPVYVKGAKPGMTLKVHVEQIIPANWGWSRVGGGDAEHLARIGFEGEEHFLLWDLDYAARLCKSNEGHMVAMDPFMGVMAVAPDSEGTVRTHLPGIHGGNLDCKDIIAGSTLYMPVYAEGALFSTGDGHARQGNGESGCTAIECPMRTVRMTFEAVNEPFEYLACDSPRGWITFGFNSDLTSASYEALMNMVRLMRRLHHFSQKEALNLAGAVVDLSVTQIVNGIRGVHAVLPHGAIMQIN